MKYIRTKDGRIVEFEGHFALIDDIDKETKKIVSYRLYQIEQEPYVLEEMNILKEADSIEELCDYLFYRNRDGKIVIRELPFDYGLASIKSSLKNNDISDVKLAILTDDKGLIYVAELNKDGESKLI